MNLGTWELGNLRTQEPGISLTGVRRGALRTEDGLFAKGFGFSVIDNKNEFTLQVMFSNLFKNTSGRAAENFFGWQCQVEGQNTLCPPSKRVTNIFHDIF